jgi:hypothetical protein
LTALADLLASSEPSLRYKARTGALGEDPDSPAIQALRGEIRDSPRVRALLSGRTPDGRLRRGNHVYQKWQGAHWVMATLADLGYGPGDESLATIRDQLLDAWLAPHYFTEFEANGSAASYRGHGVPIMEGRHRRCASQQGNALYAIATLGLTNERTLLLAERLLHWQWPDGGWNCDRNPAADTSSFMETLTPLRGLAALNRVRPDAALEGAIARAADVFLSRQLCLRRSDGALIHPDFITLHYPLYWHYDILGGLKVLAETGLVRDQRCGYALDLLEEKRLADGGWPAEKRYYRHVATDVSPSGEMVDWGGTSKRHSNPWVTADALTVLAAAGRLPRDAVSQPEAKS